MIRRKLPQQQDLFRIHLSKVTYCSFVEANNIATSSYQMLKNQHRNYYGLKRNRANRIQKHNYRTTKTENKKVKQRGFEMVGVKWTKRNLCFVL